MTKRLHFCRSGAGSRLLAGSHCSWMVLRCMRMMMQRSARVSGKWPMVARTLGHQLEKRAIWGGVGRDGGRGTGEGSLKVEGCELQVVRWAEPDGLPGRGED